MAFQGLWDALLQQSVQSPCSFVLFNDASSEGIGVVVSHMTPEREKPMQYLTKQLTPAELNYATIEKEALAMKSAIDTHVLCWVGRALW